MFFSFEFELLLQNRLKALFGWKMNPGCLDLGSFSFRITELLTTLFNDLIANSPIIDIAFMQEQINWLLGQIPALVFLIINYSLLSN